MAPDRFGARAGHALLPSLLLAGAVALVLFGAHAASRSAPSAPAPLAVTTQLPPPLATVLTSRRAAAPKATAADVETMLHDYCMACHNKTLLTAGFGFDTANVSQMPANPALWEKVVRKLRTGTMPPGNAPRPDAKTYDAIAGYIEGQMDQSWTAHPYPGRINSVHRMNRTEYNNAIRDVLAVDLDVKDLLPGDETADGSFDNFADLLSITPAHLERYLSVARTVTRAAVGLPPTGPDVETTEIPLHNMQRDLASTDLPLGSRGGIGLEHDFPTDGTYRIKVRLRRQYQDYLEGMGWPQQLDVRLDDALIKRFTVGGGALQYRPSPSSYAGAGEPGGFGSPEWEAYMQLTGDAGLEVELPVTAGPHVVGVTFVREGWEPEGLPQPVQRGRVLTNDQIYMDYASVHSVSVAGPYGNTVVAKDTPSRRAIFSCQPKAAADEQACATSILSRIARRAYRRPVTDADVKTLMGFYQMGRDQGGDFDHGVQLALERVVGDPEFLLRVYRDPAGSAPVYKLSDLELASRLSFFLWSTIPDEQLLTLAEQGKLSNPSVYAAQVNRMLADPKAIDSIVRNFAAQWLNMRRIPEKLADPDIYPDFDDDLTDAFQQETALLIAGTIKEDHSILELLSADYTWANERLADFYGIPGVYGTRFRKVKLPNAAQRGGILGQAGLLSVTAYPDRTSPVLRGKWIVDNIMGAHFPPPPANVNTSLEQGKSVAGMSIRERLDMHRSVPLCASCHSVLDPLGFALENFDATGKWRDTDANGKPVDNLGTWPGGIPLNGVAGLRSMLLGPYKEQFVRTVTGKLMEFALGRNAEYYDEPEIRTIVRDAAKNDYRWSSIVMGIAKSPQFLERARGQAN